MFVDARKPLWEREDDVDRNVGHHREQGAESVLGSDNTVATQYKREGTQHGVQALNPLLGELGGELFEDLIWNWLGHRARVGARGRSSDAKR